MKKLAALLSGLFLFSSSAVFAINDVSITDTVDFDIHTFDTAAATTITATTGGLVTNIYVETNYIDLTIDNLSAITFNTTVAGNYLKVTRQSGSNDYALTPACPTTAVTIIGTGAQTVLRLQVYTTDQCPVVIPPSGGDEGGGGGGGYIIPPKEPTDEEIPSGEGSVFECSRTETTPVPFTDIIGHWAEEYITDLYCKCVIDGRTATTFAPDDYISRAELVKIILNTYNLGTDPWEELFLDVFETDWFAGYVTRAANLNIVIGFVNEDGTTSFKPNQNITRAEALKVALEAKGINDFSGYTADFADVFESDWYYDYVAYAQAKNILIGYTENLEKEGYVRDFYSFFPYRNLGDVGEDVRDLKEIMKQLGYYFGETDINFDEGLKQAIMKYQADNGIDTVGVMGPITQGFLMREELKPISIVRFKPNTPITRAEAAKIDLLVAGM